MLFRSGENGDGTEMLGQDGKPIEAIARRLSKRKAALTDIQLLERAKSERSGSACLTAADSRNNAFHEAFSALGPSDSIRALERARDKVSAWAHIFDDKAVIICAGKVHGVTYAAI